MHALRRPAEAPLACKSNNFRLLGAERPKYNEMKMRSPPGLGTTHVCSWKEKKGLFHLQQQQPWNPWLSQSARAEIVPIIDTSHSNIFLANWINGEINDLQVGVLRLGFTVSGLDDLTHSNLNVKYGHATLFPRIGKTRSWWVFFMFLCGKCTMGHHCAQKSSI